MTILKSILMSMREMHYNPINLLHVSAYTATPTYVRVLKQLNKFGGKRFREHSEQNYHSRVLTNADARKIINLDHDLELKNLDHVLPFKHAKDLIIKNPQNIVAYECACRTLAKNPCLPTDVCLVVGDPFVDLTRLTNPLRSRRIDREEALEILQAEHERGHLHTAWFKSAMLDRFYAICNCCSCCCVGLQSMKKYQRKNVLPSGYIAEFGDSCTGCAACADHCSFGAISMEPGTQGTEEKAFLLEDKCYGCGICETQCDESNITLKLEPTKGIPLDIQALA